MVAKLGGLAMPINGYGWHKRDRPASSDELVAAQRDWYLHCIEAFGPARCMFESNYPVDKASISYNVLWNAFKEAGGGLLRGREGSHVPQRRHGRLPACAARLKRAARLTKDEKKFI